MSGLSSQRSDPQVSVAQTSQRQFGAMRPGIELADIPAAVIIAVLAVIATVGFQTVFGSWGFLRAAFFGSVGAALLGIRGRRDDTSDLLKGIAWSIFTFLFLGVLVVDGIPSTDSPAVFLEGLTLGWAEVLSVSPPVDVTPQLLVVPYTVAWVGSMLGLELYRQPRQVPALAAFGPVGAMALASMLVFDSPRVALAQGCAMVAGALLIGWIQQRRRSASNRIDRSFRQAMASTTALGTVALVAVAGLYLGPRLPLVDGERFNLRQFQDPPFEPLLEPSPLAQLKASLLELNSDEIVLRVRADEPINRWTLAVMDDYTGEFWAVADEGKEAAGEFRPLDSHFPVLPETELEGRELRTAEVETVALNRLSQGDYAPVWLATPGLPVMVTSEDELDLRYNLSTGTTAVVPAGLAEGTIYQITAEVPIPVDQALLREIPTGIVERMELQPNARAYTNDVVEGRDVGWEQVEAVVTELRNEGFYDARERQRNARPGHNLSRLEEFVVGPSGLVGFEEQYAALATLMLRSQGVETRVAVGWLIPEEDSDLRWNDNEAEIRGGDASAWIEVRFEGLGWVPFDVTPPRDRQEEQQEPEPPSFRDVATINPPPPPPVSEDPPVQDQTKSTIPEADLCAEAIEEGLQTPAECLDDEQQDGNLIATWAGRTALLTPLFTIAAAVGAVLWLKRRRSRRRRSAAEPAEQIAGAWYEVTDKLREHGLVMPVGATPRAYVKGLQETEQISDDDGKRLDALAVDVNAAAFHPAPPDQVSADRSWGNADQVLESVSERWAWHRKIVYRLNPKPLFRADPLQRKDRVAAGSPNGRSREKAYDER